MSKIDPRVTSVGDLVSMIALDTVDITGLYVHPEPAMLEARQNARWIRYDTTAVFSIRRGSSASHELVRTIGGSR